MKIKNWFKHNNRFLIVSIICFSLGISIFSMTTSVIKTQAKEEPSILYTPNLSFVNPETGELDDRNLSTLMQYRQFYVVDNNTFFVYFYQNTTNSSFMSPVYDTDGKLMTYDRLLEIYQRQE